VLLVDDEMSFVETLTSFDRRAGAPRRGAEAMERTARRWTWSCSTRMLGTDGIAAWAITPSPGGHPAHRPRQPEASMAGMTGGAFFTSAGQH
jgi:hypothetical protein